MGQNYLYREVGIQINALLSRTAWNLKKLMEVLKKQAARLLWRFFPDLFTRFFLSFERLGLFVRSDCLQTRQYDIKTADNKYCRVCNIGLVQ
jgi:hypothetical protein